MTLLRSLIVLTLITGFGFVSVASAAIQADTGAVAAEEKKADTADTNEGKKKKGDEEPECD